MTWILFVYISTFSAHGVSLAAVEFNTKAACEHAAQEAKENFKQFATGKPKTMCVEKGQLK